MVAILMGVQKIEGTGIWSTSYDFNRSNPNNSA